MMKNLGFLLVISSIIFYTGFYPMEGMKFVSLSNNFQSLNSIDTIHAQLEIEIESNGNKRLAKLFDRIKKDDKLRVFVKPKKDCVVWVLVENENGIELVNSSVVLENRLNILPSRISDYEVDGKSSYEKFIFIFALGRDSHLINSSFDNVRLKNVLADVKKKSEITIAEDGDELIDISGNVRDPYLVSKKMYKGINYLTVEFHFDVKK